MYTHTHTTTIQGHKEKLVKYEMEVVDLSNAGDKAEERAAGKNKEIKKIKKSPKVGSLPELLCKMTREPILQKFQQHCNENRAEERVRPENFFKSQPATVFSAESSEKFLPEPTSIVREDLSQVGSLLYVKEYTDMELTFGNFCRSAQPRASKARWQQDQHWCVYVYICVCLHVCICVCICR